MGSKRAGDDLRHAYAFGQCIQRWRAYRGLSLGALGRRVGLSRGYLCDIEHGRKIPTVFNAVRIGSTLGVGVEALIGGALPPAAPPEATGGQDG